MKWPWVDRRQLEVNEQLLERVMAALERREVSLERLVAAVIEMRREGFSPPPPPAAAPTPMPPGIILPDEVIGAIRERAGGNAQLRRELNEAAWSMLEQKMEPVDVAKQILRGESLDGLDEEVEEGDEEPE